MSIKHLVIPIVAFGLLLSACLPDDEQAEKESNDGRATAYASTYAVTAVSPVLIENVIVLDGKGEQLGGKGAGVDVLLTDGKINRIGSEINAPAGTVVVSGNERYLTPGLIDVHSHMGVYPQPEIAPHADGNEMVAPNTAAVWVEHSVWPQDPAFEKAIAGGVTTVQILPGSANLFGGRGVVLKNVPAVSMQQMKFPGAPHALKMACGENPKRVYGEKGGPATRMGNMAGYRAAWIKAQEYQKKWQAYDPNDENGDAPERDLQLETLSGVLNGDIRVHNHCYRADEMVNMIDLAKEFGYKISAFHHAIEAYKVAPKIVENDICAVVWADWWGFKQESMDMIRENAALIDHVGGCAIIHSDDAVQVQRLPQEVAKVMQAAEAMGKVVTAENAIRWITSNAAKSIGLDDQIGTVSTGMNADVVLWSGDPFSVYTKADKVWIDGVLQFDRTQPGRRPTSDFYLGRGIEKASAARGLK